MNLDHILQWELKVGSHEFPGPQGGTCINEAALVAMGFEYRSISSANDMPPCTSRVIAAYVLRLNDEMPDGERQKLLPFVTRILGTRDTEAVEQQRAAYLALETVRRILPLALRARDREAHAVTCEKVTTLVEARNAANARAYAAYAAAYAADAADAAAYAAKAAAYAAAYAAKAAAYAAEAAAEAAKLTAADAAPSVWTVAVEILDGCMRIGKQPEDVDVQQVAARMVEARNICFADA